MRASIRRLVATVGVATLLALILTSCSDLPVAKAPNWRAASQDLCSLEGLMRLVPATQNASGQFELPDPTKDLPAFLDVHQSLTRVINTTLTQAQMAQDSYSIADEPNPTLKFGPAWRSAEIGAATDGTKISFPDTTFASFGGPSFMNGITPVPETGESMYQIVQDAKIPIPALVNAQPTAVPCVNRILLAAANTGGTWAPPSYALGPAGGDAFLVVDLCLDLAKPVPVGGKTALGPNGAIFVALQWADTDDLAHMRTDQQSKLHSAD